MILNIFTILCGIATLLGFALQIFDVFPSHKDMRQKVTLVISGLFIGALIGILSNSEITFDFSVTGLSLVSASIILIILILAVSGICSSEAQKRIDLLGSAGIAMAVLLLILFIGSAIVQGSKPLTNDQITNDEFLVLMKYSEKAKNYDRAIMFIESIKARLPGSDKRQTELSEILDELKKKQMK